jgi:hypothetical protein
MEHICEIKFKFNNSQVEYSFEEASLKQVNVPVWVLVH